MTPCWVLVLLLLLASSTWAAATTTTQDNIPVWLNLVLVGFHDVKSGYVSDLDATPQSLGYCCHSVTLLSRAAYVHLRGLVQSDSLLSAVAMERELDSLNHALSLRKQGFTLFVMNFEGRTNYSYGVDDHGARTVASPHTTPAAAAASSNRGEDWARHRKPPKSAIVIAHQHAKGGSRTWVSNHRFAWIDLSARRTLNDEEEDVDVVPPTREVFLPLLQAKAKELLLPLAGGGDHARFVAAWQSRLGQVQRAELSLLDAYDVVSAAETSWLEDGSSSSLASVGPVAPRQFLRQLRQLVRDFETNVLMMMPQSQLSSVSSSAVLVQLVVIHTTNNNNTNTGPSDDDDDVAFIHRELSRLSPPVTVNVRHVHLDDDGQQTQQQDAETTLLLAAVAMAQQRDGAERRRYIDAAAFVEVVHGRAAAATSSVLQLDCFWFADEEVRVDPPHQATTTTVVVGKTTAAQAVLLGLARAWLVSEFGVQQQQQPQRVSPWAAGAGDAWGRVLLMTSPGAAGLSTIFVDAFHRQQVYRALASAAGNEPRWRAEVMLLAKQNDWTACLRVIQARRMEQQAALLAAAAAAIVQQPSASIGESSATLTQWWRAVRHAVWQRVASVVV